MSTIREVLSEARSALTVETFLTLAAVGGFVAAVVVWMDWAVNAGVML